jgi:hypothetical protein
VHSHASADCTTVTSGATRPEPHGHHASRLRSTQGRSASCACDARAATRPPARIACRLSHLATRFLAPASLIAVTFFGTRACGCSRTRHFEFWQATRAEVRPAPVIASCGSPARARSRVVSHISLRDSARRPRRLRCRRSLRHTAAPSFAAARELSISKSGQPQGSTAELLRRKRP